MTNKLGLTISVSPHIHSRQHTRQIMLDVVIALAPSLLLAAGLLHARAIFVVFFTVFACVSFEALFNLIARKHNTLTDCSAIVTGVILACCFNASVPLWMPILGSFFAIVVVKQAFGGLGNNYLNPALTASLLLVNIRRFLAANVPALPDAVSAATPLAQMKEGALPTSSLMTMLFQKTGGTIGEVSSILLLIGGAYLIWRDVIKVRIPVGYLGAVAVIAAFTSAGNPVVLWVPYQLLGGSVLLGAFYIATDYASSPITPGGQWAYGIGCGILTMLLRQFGERPEGVTYAILGMNLLARALDRLGAPRRYGTRRSNP